MTIRGLRKIVVSAHADLGSCNEDKENRNRAGG
jgi:hypothetical protein